MKKNRKELMQKEKMWLLTFSDTAETETDHYAIRSVLDSAFMPDYYCMADELTANGCQHTHVFLYRHFPAPRSILKELFPDAHIEPLIGSFGDCRNYVAKEGRFAKLRETELHFDDTFEEYDRRALCRSVNGRDLDLAALFLFLYITVVFVFVVLRTM